MKFVELKIKDELLNISPLTAEDVMEMSNSFTKHSDPLYRPYDFDEMNLKQAKHWLSYKNGLSNRYYAIRLNSGECIGYIGLKRIRRLKRKSTLGLMIGPDYMSRGYGGRAMRLFLNSYFNELDMRSMDLEVTSFNRRALSLYTALGFVEKSRHMEYHDDDSLRPEDVVFDAYEGLGEYRGKITTYVIYMTLDADDYFRRDIT